MTEPAPRELTSQQEPQAGSRAWCFHAARDHDRLHTAPDRRNYTHTA